jgi:hypothetical protein
LIEGLVVLLVLGAATIVFYPVLAGVSRKHGPRTGAPRASESDDETAEQLAALTETRGRLLRNIHELETERTAGRLAETDFVELRRRDEIQAARVIREIETLQAEQRAARKKGPTRSKKTAPAPAPRRVGKTLAWVGGTAAFAVILVLTMSRSVAPRAPGGTITGTIPGSESGGAAGGAAAPSPMLPAANPARLAEVERLVKRDSSNLKALLEAGHLYLAERRLDEAAQVTMKALAIDAENAEAHAHVAVLLMAEANSQEDADSARRAVDAAVDAVNHAIQAQPDLAEAWLFKGMVLMAGRQDMPGAAQAWEQYLKIAPPGADTTRIHAMVQAAKRSGAR